ncbi:MAG: hypothetical protein QNK36_16255, partial [Colwellia sp.]|nr:hypothetical protein [Colwellia sp.]MDX2369928.1 hypothetical protein [Colwellia sp.]
IIFVLFNKAHNVNEIKRTKELTPVLLKLTPAVNFSVIIIITVSVLLGIFPDLLGSLLVTAN